MKQRQLYLVRLLPFLFILAALIGITACSSTQASTPTITSAAQPQTSTTTPAPTTATAATTTPATTTTKPTATTTTGTTQTTTAKTTGTTPTSSTAATTTTGSGLYKISIGSSGALHRDSANVDNAYALNINLGDTVQWTDLDPEFNNLTITGSGWGSGPLNYNQTYKYTFTAAGTFQYYCSVARSQLATIIVK